MVRHCRRRLEVEPFHRADAAIRPMRQQHRRHRRAVRTEPRRLVFPEGGAAAVGLPHSAHGVDQIPVFGAAAAVGVGRLGFVALEVVLHPVSAEVDLARAQRPPAVDAVVTEAAPGKRPQRQSDRDDHRGPRQRHSGPRQHRRQPARRAVVGDTPARHPAAAHADRLACAQRGEQIDGHVIEGQDSHIPETSLGQQHETGRYRRRCHCQRHAQPRPSPKQQHGRHHSQHHEGLQRRIVSQEAVVELAARPQRRQVAAILAPAHVVEQIPVPPERQHPPGAERRADSAGDKRPGRPAPPGSGSPRRHQDESRQHAQREEGGEQVHQPGDRQEHSRRHLMRAPGHAPRQEADEQDRGCQTQRVGELACHRRHQVAAVNVE